MIRANAVVISVQWAPLTKARLSGASGRKPASAALRADRSVVSAACWTHPPMTLLLADGKEFAAFFTKQVSIRGQVVRENNIKA